QRRGTGQQLPPRAARHVRYDRRDSSRPRDRIETGWRMDRTRAHAGGNRHTGGGRMSERPAPQLTPMASGRTALGFAGSVIRMLPPFASLAAAALFFRILAPDHPFRLIDAQIVSTHTVIVGIAALGMTFLIAAGGIDLSVGSAIALTTVCVALVLKRDWP